MPAAVGDCTAHTDPQKKVDNTKMWPMDGWPMTLTISSVDKLADSALTSEAVCLCATQSGSPDAADVGDSSSDSDAGLFLPRALAPQSIPCIDYPNAEER